MTYRIITYYRRGHELNFATKQEAEEWLATRRVRCKSLHYSELWEMKDDESGEQLGLFENSTLELVPK